MQRHIPLHGLPLLAICKQRVGHVHPLPLFVALVLLVGILTKVKGVLECLLVNGLVHRPLLLYPITARVRQGT